MEKLRERELKLLEVFIVAKRLSLDVNLSIPASEFVLLTISLFHSNSNSLLKKLMSK